MTEDGTEAHPFLIQSKQELLDFQTCINSNSNFYFNGNTYVRTCSGSGCVLIVAGGKLPGNQPAHFKLMTDVVVNEGNVAACEGVKDPSWSNWTPLKSFGGVFDGNYHIISGIYCKQTTEKVGVFSELSAATVKNLGISNSYIKGVRYVGGMAGDLVGASTVTHCFFWGTVESDNEFTGGIAGANYSGSTISNCYTTGLIYSENLNSGGIAGINRTGGSTIQNCYSTMWNTSETGLRGGICGENRSDEGGIVNNCYYDKQMTTVFGENNGVGMLTRDMVASSFVSTLGGGEFIAQTDLYPTLSGFDPSSKYVLLSTVPIYLQAVSNSNFEHVENMHSDYTVSTATGGTWSIYTWNEASTFVAPNQVQVHRHGVSDLTCSLDGLSRSWPMIPKIWPYLGTETNPFLITDLTDLNNFREGINSGVKFKYKRILVKPAELDTLHWLQTADINLSSVTNYTPCGISANGEVYYFRGFYDGGHHKIQNLRMRGSSGRYTGFFGQTKNATIKNLDFENPDISGGYNPAVICSYSIDGLAIDSCNVYGGTLTGSGVICGAAKKNASISHCSVQDMTISGSGILGSSVSSTRGEAASTQVISYCTVQNSTITGSTVGGICGSMGINDYYAPRDAHNILNCTVSGTPVTGSMVGGICGYFDNGTIQNCLYQDAAITSTGYVGGICGEMYNRGRYTIDNCVCRATSVTSSNSAAGGICGYTYNSSSSITNCKNYSPVRGRNAAGILGQNWSSWSSVSIHHCLNVASIEATGSSDDYESGMAGGIVSDNCYVSYCINIGVVKGNTYVQGIGGSASYSMNTGDVYLHHEGTNTSWGVGGISHSYYNNSVTHCVNYGNVFFTGNGSYASGSEEEDHIRVWGLGHNSSNSFNVGRVVGVECGSPSGRGSNSYYDLNFVGDQYARADGTGLETDQMLGSGSSLSTLGTSYWIYEAGCYPRLKWTDDYAWAKDVAIAASQPVRLVTEEEDANNVKQGIKLYGCNNGLTWRLEPATDDRGGCIFSEDLATLPCSGNAIAPAVVSECPGLSVVAAVRNDTVVKRVLLRPYVAPPAGILTIDNLAELQAFRDSINAEEPFWWKGNYVPRFATGTHFRLTTDITMPSGAWYPIGTDSAMFRGVFHGDNHTISGLNANRDNSGLFGHVSGTVQDLNLTNVNLSGDNGNRGAVCAYLLNGKILNCHVSGGAISGGFTGGVVGSSCGKDTIMDCVSEYAASSGKRIGGIVSLVSGNTYISGCVNKTDITGDREGGIVALCESIDEDTARLVVHNCTNEGNITGVSVVVNETSSFEFRSYGNVGGIVGSVMGVSVVTATHCTNKGNISSDRCSAGGIIGQTGYIADRDYDVTCYVSYCTNEGKVSNAQIVNEYLSLSAAGIVAGYNDWYHRHYNGYSNNRNDIIITNCTNYGEVEGVNVAGICGYGTASDCVNAGDVKGLTNAVCVAGVCAEGVATRCYNVGILTALAGSSSSDRYVGGVVGTGKATYCYNAGQVFGFNSKYAGGVVGFGGAEYCYNSNTVRATGTHAGSVVGYTGEDPYSHEVYTTQNCFYDKQMSLLGGEDGNDNTVAGLSTTEMLGTGLQSQLGTSSVWTFNSDYYPQLSAYAGTAPSLSSVMPVLLQNDETALQVNNSFYMHGCDDGEWRILQGSALRLDTDPAYHQCQATTIGSGIVQIGTAVNGTVYRRDRLLVGSSDYVIKNLTEMRNFRDVINSDGFYNMTDSTYHTTLSSADSAHIDEFVEIHDGGLDLSFKLVTDLDMASETNWLPIGAYSVAEADQNKSFQGVLKGQNHIIRNFSTPRGDYKGLFGKISMGEVHDLHIVESGMSKSGSCRALLCAFNNSGVIENCTVENSYVRGESSHIGLICGENQFGTIRQCNAISDTIYSSGMNQFGSICGYQHFGIIDSCFAEKVVLNGLFNHTGGICGQNDRGTVSHCQISDSYLDAVGNEIGGICGVVPFTEEEYNYSSYNYEDTSKVYDCKAIRVVMKGDVQKMGGIIGWMCEYSSLHDCSVTGGSITSTTKNIGGIVGYLYYGGEAYNCTNANMVQGKANVGGIFGCAAGDEYNHCMNYGTVKGDYEVGGVVGQVYGTLRYCGNYAPVSGKSYVGGVAGSGTASYENLEYCFNKGNVTAESCVGGVLGSNQYHERAESNYNRYGIRYCYNTGNVTASNDKAGGVVGYVYQEFYGIYQSFNTGMVTAKKNVGGLIGYANKLTHYAFSNSYNAGIVSGRSQVGGLVGFLTAESSSTSYKNTASYNIGWVEGVTMVGSICGYTNFPELFDKTVSDYQMCYYDPISDEVIGNNTTKLTSQMLGSNLSGTLTSSAWTFTNGMYPRVKSLDTAAASIASVTPVNLPVSVDDTLRADGLPVGEYSNILGSASSLSWARVEGNGITVSGNSINATEIGMVRIGDVINGDTIKVVQLMIGLANQRNIPITDRIQLKKFRDLINSGEMFYFDPVRKEFHESENDGYVVIYPYGEGKTFYLTDDIDLSLESEDWDPIGYDDGNNSVVIMQNGTTLVTCGENVRFYDSGGPDANYNNSENFTHVFTSVGGERLSIRFLSTQGEHCCDNISIYDGPTASGLTLGSGVMNGMENRTFVSSGSSLTVRFSSDGSSVGAGWDAIVGCATAEQIGEHVSHAGETISETISVPCDTILSFYDTGGENGNYDMEQECSYLFNSEGNQQLLLHFLYVGLEENGYDFIKIYDGDNTGAPLMYNSYTDGWHSMSGTSYTSTGSSMLVTFHSDSYGNYAGWSATVRCATQEEAENSGPTQDIHTDTIRVTCGQTVRFYDSGGPYGNYGNNEVSAYRFISDIDTALSIHFRSVAIQEYVYGEHGDPSYGEYLEIYDGNTLIFSSRENSLNELLNNTFTATAALTVIFHSDAYNTYPGWEAEVTCASEVPASVEGVLMCHSGGNVTVPSDTVIRFYDSGGPNRNFGRNENCSCTFVPEDGHSSIRIRFRNAELGDNYLYIYDGPSASGSYMYSTSNSGWYSLPGSSFMSSGSALTVSFRTDSYATTYAGWEAEVSCVSAAEMEGIRMCDGSNTVSVPLDTVIHFYDSGGPTGNAGNGENCYKVFSSADGTSPVSICFQNVCPSDYYTLYGYTYIEVFDGNSTSSPRIFRTSNDGWDALQGRTFTSTSSTHALTVRFYSYRYGNTLVGWEALVSCGGPENVMPRDTLPVNGLLMCDGSQNIVCDSLLRFYDSGGPNHTFGRNENYTYTFMAEVGKRVSLSFVSAVFGSDARLEIYDADNTSGNRLFSSRDDGCYFLSGETFNSTGRALTVYFYNSSSATYAGWDALVSCVEEIEGLPMLDGSTTVTCGDTIRFYDSGGPNGNYGRREDATHEFTAEAGSQATIYFMSAVLGQSNSDYDDYIVIEDEGNGTLFDSRNSRWTSLAGRTFTSTGGTLRVTFHSNERNQYAGWEARVYCSQANSSDILMRDGAATVTCGDTLHFYDTGGPTGDYSENENYTYTFNAEGTDDHVMLRFLSATLGNTQTSYSGIIQIYDGENTEGTELYNSENEGWRGLAGRAFRSSERSLTVYFYSYSWYGTSNGWDAMVTCASAEEDGMVMSNGTTPVPCDTVIRFYDSGGLGGQYGNNENLTHTFTSTGDARVSIHFSVFNVAYDDLFEIYDGSGTTGRKLASTYSNGNGSDVFAGRVFTSSGNSLTVRFTSDSYETYAGWEAEVHCADDEFTDGIVMDEGGTLVSCDSAIHFYDSGGPDGDSYAGERTTHTFVSEGEHVSIQFLAFQRGSDNDYIYIYDGPSDGGEQLNENSYGYALVGQRFVSTGRSLTVKYESSYGGTSWDALVSCSDAVEQQEMQVDLEAAEEPSFLGIFDGKNHVVSGMSITTGEKDKQGFFGTLLGTVKNLRLHNVNITAEGDCHGSIAGYNKGTIRNCGSTMGVVQGAKNVGGLVGYNDFDQMSDCYSGNDVTGKQFVGGIAGQCSSIGILTRCFNYGVIKGTNLTNAYVGGITGKTLTTLTHSYNTGIVQGGQYTGGIVGYNGSSIYNGINYCYNAGFVDSVTNKNVGQLYGLNSYLNTSQKSAYDWQMSPLYYGRGVTTGMGEDSYISRKNTEAMTGSGSELTSLLGTTYWTYSDGMYPRLTSMKDLDASIVSTKRVDMTESLQKVNYIRTNFKVQMGNDVEWFRYGYGNALNLEDIDNGNVKLAICGDDTLQVMKNGDRRLVPFFVKELAPITTVDTACNGSYIWAVNGRVYTHAQVDPITFTTYDQTLIPVAAECDSVLSLQITIPPVLEAEVNAHNHECYGDDEAYAEVIPSGGFGAGVINRYFYYWTMDGRTDTLSTTNRIDNSTFGGHMPAGSYHVSVRDKQHPDCEITKDITITEPDELTASITLVDAGCYNEADGRISLHIEGGTMPYTVSWTGTASGSLAPNTTTDFTITGLNDGSYQVEVEDNHHCQVNLASATLAGDDTEYSLTAVGVNKMYDGVAVNLGRYVLRIGSGTPDTIASGSSKTLADGAILTATVSNTANQKDYTTGTQNEIFTWTITKYGIDSSCRYNVITHSSPVEISKRDVVLTSATDSKLHDGDPLTNHTVTISGSGFVASEGLASTDVIGSQTNVGTSPNHFDATTPYTLTAGTNADNYVIDTVAGTLTVYAEHTLVLVAGTATKMYDGVALTEPTFTCVGLNPGDTVIATVVGSQLNAGTSANALDTISYPFSVEAIVGGASHKANYADIVLQGGTLTVTPRNVTLTTVSATKVYDGTPLARPDVTVSGDGLVAGELTYSATVEITNVGDSLNRIDTVRGADFRVENYNLTLNQGHLVVNPRKVAVTGESGTLAYNGDEQCLTGITVAGLLSSDTLTGITYAACGTLAGDYAGSFSGGISDIVIMRKADNTVVTGNYQINALVPGTLTITANNLPLVVTSNSRDFMYDGQPHHHYSYTVLYNGVAITPVNDTIFTLPTGDVLTIHPAGAGRGITHVDESGLNDFTYELEHEASYDNLTFNKQDINITPRMVNLRSPNYSIVYDGVTSIPALSDMVDSRVERAGYGFATGEGVNCTFSNSIRRRDVGSSPNAFSYAFNSYTRASDYVIDTTYGTLTVSPAVLALTAVDTFRLYGEENPTPFRYTLSGFVNGQDTTHGAPFVGSARPVLTTTATADSPVGHYTISIDLTGVSFANYTIEPHVGTLDVRYRPVTVTAYSTPEIPYDGVEHTWQENVTGGRHYEVTAGQLRPNDTIREIHISGARTVAGTTYIELSGARIWHYTVSGIDTVWTEVTSNYEPVYVNGLLTIMPREIALKPFGYEHVFTGHTYNSDSTAAPHFQITAGSLASRDTIVTMNIIGSRSAMGTTPFVIDSLSIVIVNRDSVQGDYTNIDPRYNIAGGYHILFDTATLRITPRPDEDRWPVTLYGLSDTVIYDGESHGVSGFVSNEFTINGHTYHVTGLTSKVENKVFADEYPTTITGTAQVLDVDNNDVTSAFIVTAQPGRLKISKRPLELTAFGCNVEYDGQLHSANEMLWPRCYITGGTSISTTDQIRKIYTEGERSIPGTTITHIVTDSVQLENRASHATMTDNYDIRVVDSTIVITDRAVPFEILVRAAHDTVTYNSEIQSPGDFETLDFTVNGYHFTVGGLTAGVSGTEVGIYKNEISGTPVVLDERNDDVTAQFHVTTKDDTLQITPCAITLTAADSLKKYDGHPLICQKWVSPVAGLGIHDTITSVTITGSQTTVGTCSNVLSAAILKRIATDADVSANYDITYVNGTLTVVRDTPTIVITTVPTEWEYDGEPHYKDSVIVVYNGDTLTPDITGTAFELPTGDTIHVILPVVRDSVTDVTDTTIVTIDYYINHPDNYATDSVRLNPGKLTVSAKPLTITVNDTMAYNGSVLTTSYSSTALTAATLVAGDAFTAGAVSTNGAAIGTYTSGAGTSAVTTDFATTNGIGNYEVTYDFTQVITRACCITLQPVSDTTEMYDGAPFGPTVTGTTPTGEDVTVEYSTDGGTTWTTTPPTTTHVADTVTVTVRGTSENYDTLTTTYKIMRSPRPIELTAGTQAFEYDGSTHDYHVVSSTGAYHFVGTDTVTLTFDAASVITYVDESPVTNRITGYTPVGFTEGDYAITFVDGTLTMGQRALTITAADSIKKYDGTPLTNSRWMVDATGLYAGDTVTSVTVTGTQTVVGSSNNVPSAAVIKRIATDEDVTSSYAINYVNGTLTVVRDTPTIVITTVPTEWEYDGEPHYKDSVIVVYNGDTLTPDITGTAFELPTGDTIHVILPVVRDSVTDVTDTTIVTIDYYINHPDNYATDSVRLDPGKLTVSAKPLVITVNDTMAYNGSVLTTPYSSTALTATLVAGDAFTAGAVSTNGSAIGTYTSGASTSAVTTDFATTNGIGNYELTYDFTQVITRACCITLQPVSDTTEMYDGDPFGPTVTGTTPNGEDVTVEYSTDGGVTWTTTPPTTTHVIDTVTVTVRGTSENYDTLTTTYKIMRSPRPIELTAGTQAFEYDGNPHDYHVASSTGSYNFVGTDTVTLTFDAASVITYVDESPVTNRITGYTPVGFTEGDYAITFVDGTLTMAYGPKTPLAITSASKIWPYDDMDHSLPDYRVSVNGGVADSVHTADHTYRLPNGDTLTVTVSGIVHNVGDSIANHVDGYTLTNHGHNVADNYEVTVAEGFLMVLDMADDVPPTFTTPADTTICRVSGEIVAPVSMTGDVTDEHDNYSTGLDAVWTDIDTLPTDNSGIRIIRREWTLEDAAGNVAKDTQNIRVLPSVLTPGNIEFFCPDTVVTLKYGACDTLLALPHTLINHMTGMTLVLDSAGTPYSHRYNVDFSPYTITWRVTDECGDYVEFTQTVTVKYPPCGGDYWVEDGDHNWYPTVRVGCNCWTGRNARSTHYTDGTPIEPAPMQYTGTEQHPEDTIYGKLYTYSNATRITPTRATRAAVPQQVQGVCPDGWHIPDDGDFEDLMARYEATQLMSATPGHWLTPGTDDIGFTLEPAGMFNPELLRYEYLHVKAFLWSYTPGSTILHACEFGSACGTIEIIPATASTGYSVRCVKDAE